MTHPHRRNTNWPSTLRRMPQHGTIHDSLYNAFGFGLFAAYELESEDRELLQKLISEWRSQYRRPNDARLIGKLSTQFCRPALNLAEQIGHLRDPTWCAESLALDSASGDYQYHVSAGPE